MIKLEAIKIKYGREEVSIQPHSMGFHGMIESNAAENDDSEEQVILKALEAPVGSRRLREIARPGEKICIIISDITRAWQRMNVYLPYIVVELNKSGVMDKDITFLCATGSHRPQTEKEHGLLLGEKLAGRFKVTDHDCKDLKSMTMLGTTSFGTPVIINSKALESDHIILTGAIVFHDLAGWGGGKKSILPGISAYQSIMANHSLSLKPGLGEGLNPQVRCGSADNNPVHLDMMEAAAFVKPSFLFNVIIDENGSIGKAVAGDYIKAHEEGRRLVDEADSAYIGEKADLVVVSAGGYPKDIDLYQASKALVNAKEAVVPGGFIILLAECSEGFGHEEVRLMLEDFGDCSGREKALRESFTVAKYTGYLISKIAEGFNVILISSIEPDKLKNCGINTAATLEAAMEFVESKAGSGLKAYYMPNGSNTLPRMVL